MRILLPLLLFSYCCLAVNHYTQKSAERLRDIQTTTRSSVGGRWGVRGGIDYFHWAAHHHRALKHRADFSLLIEFRVMVVCSVHARELVTTELCADWIDYVLSEERVRLHNITPWWRLPDVEWLIVPIANPRGSDIVRNALKLHRTGEEIGSQDLRHRGNANGVDLNRNWPNIDSLRMRNERVQQAHLEEGAHSAAAAFYREKQRIKQGARRRENDPIEENAGTHEFSEPETRGLRELISRFQPHLLFDVHSGTTSILMPYDSSTSFAPTHEQLIKMTNWLTGKDVLQMPDSIRTGPGSRYLYASNGTMCDYAYEALSVPYPFTLEIYQDLRAAENSANSNVALFASFNPTKRKALEAVLEQWRRIPQALMNLNDAEQTYLATQLSNVEEPLPLLVNLLQD